MNSRDISHSQTKPVANSLRAALHCATLRVVGDNLLEIADEAAPSEQVLDSSLFLAPSEMGDGVEERINALIEDFQEQLAALGIGAVGLLFVGSERGLFRAREEGRGRLYGTRPSLPSTASELEPEMAAP